VDAAAPPAPPGPVLLPVASEAEAMDWSLVLASQSIEATILPPAEGARGWAVAVSPADVRRALRELAAFRAENRRWRTAVPVADLHLHWGVLLWLVFMALVAVTDEPRGALTLAGRMDATAVRVGEAWRPVTATMLHANPAHLAMNLVSGFVFLGLAMGRLGFGVTLLATLLGGVAGNLLGLAFRGAYLGVGASGAVMAALGLLAAAAWVDGRRAALPRLAVAGLGAAGLLFVLLGVDPRSDVLAHAGGFAAGLLLGWPLARLTAGGGPRARLEGLCLAAYAVLVLGGWALALR
jgi:membrane associated rhomboid family serine protease